MNPNSGVFNARQTSLAGFRLKDKVLSLEVGKRYGTVSWNSKKIPLMNGRLA